MFSLLTKTTNICEPSLALLLGIGGTLWITTEVFVPQISQASTAHINLSLERQPNETYAALVHRAEAVAGPTIQTEFSRDPEFVDVVVIVEAQNQGAVVPILSIHVSRLQWQKQSSVQHWGRYFNARTLLGFDTKSNSNPEAPVSNNSDPTSIQQEQDGFDPESPEAIVPVEVPDASKEQV